MDQYVYIKNNISIRKGDNEFKLSVEDKDSRKGERLYTINEDALNIITKFSGEYKLNEIIEQLSNYYNEEFDEIKSKLLEFLNLMRDNYDLDIEYSKAKINKNIEIINIKNPYYPKSITLELTHKCNFKCLHCYGEYDNTAYEYMDLEKVKKFLLECKEIGVQTIELTGGEITMHPNVAEILKYIHELGFGLVALLTNGYIRNEELYKTIIENKEKMIVQIDMHGNTEEYLTWFTKVPNTQKIVEENIKYLHSHGVKLRIVTTVTPRNLHQVESIADWVHGLGINSYAINPVLATGRANHDPNGLLLKSVDHIEAFQRLLCNIAEKYGKKFINIISAQDSENSLDSNCGALVSNPTISPEGNLKICAMDDLEIVSPIGNVFDEGLKNVYDNNLDYIKIFKNLKSPKFDTEGCKKCEHIEVCHGCVLRALKKGLSKGKDCSWLQELVPVQVKDKMKQVAFTH